MTYDPPDGDTVTFEAEAYESPSGGAVDFDFTQFVVVNADPVTLDLDTPDAFVAPIKQVARPDAIELELSTPDAFVSPGVPVRPDAVELDLATPNALIQPFLLTDEWQVDRERIRPAEIEATAETLSLSFEIGRDELDIWREYDRAGDLSTDSGFGGAFRAIGRDGDDDVEVRTAFNRLRPFIPSTSYRVAGYSETQLSPTRFEIGLELQRVTNRGEGFPELSQTGAWEFDLQHGTVGLSERQVGQIDREGAPPGAEVSVEVLVSDDQAAALLDNLGYPAGVVERSVPDADSARVDETGGRQTVTLSAPAEAALASGDWFVVDWTLSFNAYSEERQWAVELALAETTS